MEFLKALKEAQSQGVNKDDFLRVWEQESKMKMAQEELKLLQIKSKSLTLGSSGTGDSGNSKAVFDFVEARLSKFAADQCQALNELKEELKLQNQAHIADISCLLEGFAALVGKVVKAELEKVISTLKVPEDTKCMSHSNDPMKIFSSNLTWSKVHKEPEESTSQSSAKDGRPKSVAQTSSKNQSGSTGSSKKQESKSKAEKAKQQQQQHQPQQQQKQKKQEQPKEQQTQQQQKPQSNQTQQQQKQQSNQTQQQQSNQTQQQQKQQSNQAQQQQKQQSNQTQQQQKQQSNQAQQQQKQKQQQKQNQQMQQKQQQKKQKQQQQQKQQQTKPASARLVVTEDSDSDSTKSSLEGCATGSSNVSVNADMNSEEDISCSVQFFPIEGPVNLLINDASKLAASGEVCSSPIYYLQDCTCKVRLNVWFDPQQGLCVSVSLWGLSAQDVKTARIFTVEGMIKNRNSQAFSPLFTAVSAPVKVLKSFTEKVLNMCICLKTSTASFSTVTVKMLKERNFILPEKESLSINWTVKSSVFV